MRFFVSAIVLFVSLLASSQATIAAQLIPWEQLYKQRNYDLILSTANELLQINSKDLDAAYYRAIALYHLGKRDESRPLLQSLQATYKANNDITSQYRYAMTFYYLSENQRAIPLLAKLTTLTDAPEAAETYLAYAYAKIGQHQQAVATFDHILSYRQDHSLYYNRATVQLNADHPDQAVTDLQASIKLKPNFQLAYLELIAIYATQGKITLALEWLDKCLAKGTRDLSRLSHDPDLVQFVSSEGYLELLKKYKM